MYKIKQIPEDFVVKERITLKTAEQGKFSYWLLKKRDYTTMKALDKIAFFLRIPLKNIGFAGAKDRQAVTEQYISIKGAQKDRIEQFVDNDIKLTFGGFGDEPISMGALDGNDFEIVIRNITEAPPKIDQIINYFDDQRFSRNNHLVGKAILKKDFKGACELLDEGHVARHLEAHPNDYVGAIKTIHFKIRLIFVHAFQSYLFNRMVSKYLQCKYTYLQCKYSHGDLVFPTEPVDAIKVPLIGFGTEFKDPEIDKYASELLEEEGIGLRDFVIRTMPELSSEGTVRDIVVPVGNLRISEPEQDELNDGMKKVRVDFSLPKGSYATMVIKRMLLQA